MKNKLIAIALSTLTLTLTASIVPTVATQPATGQTTNTATWQLFSPKGQRFSILMPIGKIEVDILENGARKDYSFRTDQEAFVVGLYDVPPQIANPMETLAKLRTKAINGHNLVSSRNFGLNGNPGIEVTYANQGQPGRSLIMRCIVVQRTIYVIAAVTDSPERANTFLSSFRLR